MELDEADLTRRADRAAQAWHPGVALHGLRVLPGGSSSLVYVADVEGGPPGEASVVLKVAPPGLPPVRNRDMLRQGRVMQALAGVTGVRVPALLFDDPGDPPEIPPFIATSFVAGECYEPILEAARELRPRDEVRSRAFAAARMLAELHRVPAEHLGLDEPAVGLTDEIDRWTRALETVDDSLRTGYEAVAAALHASVPQPLPTVVVHGDYRLGNMLCASGEVEAIIDWEIWAISDPRIDLAWFLFFTDEAEHAAVAQRVESGMPTAAELLGTYEEASGAPVPDLDWFHALTRYKEAGATALIFKRLRKQGVAASDQMNPDMTVRCLQDAAAILARTG